MEHLQFEEEWGIKWRIGGDMCGREGNACRKNIVGIDRVAVLIPVYGHMAFIALRNPAMKLKLSIDGRHALACEGGKCGIGIGIVGQRPSIAVRGS